MLKIERVVKRISNTVLIITFSFLSMACYSADAIVLQPEKKGTVTDINEQSVVDASPKDNADLFCVVEAFGYVVDWVAKAIKRIENEHFSPKSNDTAEEAVPATVSTPVTTDTPVAVIEEEPKVILDLTIPDIKHEGTMGVDKGQQLNFPDMFSAQAKKPYSKEVPSSSFGGRLLMDDAELENMDEYRLNTVREAVRGAEVSLEFKTN